MKHWVYCIVLAVIYSCKGQTPASRSIQEYTYKSDKRPLYVIGLTVPGPYELYINDIAAEKEYDPGMHNLGVDINPYVLKSGKYKFKLRVFPMPSELEKGGIQPSTASFIKVTLDKGEKNDKEVPRARPGSYELLKEYAVPAISQPVPFLDIEGEFEVELPYELEGWSQGQDLSKIDSTRLKEKVVKYYEKLWNILNEGEGEEWFKKEQKRRKETYIFNYTSENAKKEMEGKSIDNIKRFAKGNMTKIDNYQLFIYETGHLVTLEKIDKENKGEGVLRTLEPDGAVRIYNIKLYLPQGSDEFVIIRK